MIGFKSFSELVRNAAVLRSAGRKLRRGQAGSALVEFALSISLLLTMVFGIVEFGWALYTYQFVNEVARSLTRYAIVRGSSCSSSSTMPNCGFTDTGSTLQTYAQANYVYPGMTMSNLSVTDKWYSPTKNSDGTIKTWTLCASGTGCNGPGYMVQVTVTYPFLLNVPFAPQQTLTVKSSSSMVISQ